jgi:serine/threonine protein kinase
MASLSQEKRIEESCDGFEAAWRAGEKPRIEDYLANTAEPEYSELLRQLLALEIELRCTKGDKPAPEEYQGRFPKHCELIEAVFAEERPWSTKPPSRGSSDQSTGPFIASPPSSDAEADRPPPLPAGTQIGRYTVCRRLGGGAYGDVYLAHDAVMGRQVAVKVPSALLLATDRAKEEFLREARSVARLQHEGIVRAYDFGPEGDAHCYIVYEFIDGESLADRIKRTRIAADPLPSVEAARIVAQVAEALHYAHLQEMFHRDLKPANILLDRQGRPKVTDFGLAVREQDLARQRGMLAGTLPYMSPEQVRRESHHIDGRTDIYSLGVVLYELLCGRRPFESSQQDELEDQILYREAKPPRQIKDSIPPELERICLKALAKRVQDRYTTAKDMAAEVLRAIEPSSNPDRDQVMAITPEDLEGRIASANEDELRRLLRYLQETADPAYVPFVFRCLSHRSEKVRQRARKAVRSIGWKKVSDAAEELAHHDDAAGITAVLDGLAAFETHPEIVGLLDRLVTVLKSDLRNRTILLLERKRLGLELSSVADLFREIHSPYRIERALGQGVFTAAYLARADGTDLAVVVRVLRPEVVGQAQLRAQFLDLSKSALQLVHENVVLTREARAFPEKKIYYAVRDFVNGVTLQKLLEGNRRFEPTQIVRLLQQLLAALGAVHRRGMCHRGVKPSNIFVCEDNRVVLGDLSLPVQGIAVALERLSYDYRYAAPEMFSGNVPVGPQADFYALGCVAYELACGEPPFVSDNYLELAALHMHAAVAPPSGRGSRLGPAGDEVLLRLLARSQADRYARAEDVLGALDRLEASWRTPGPEVQPAAPLLHDASLARFRGTESVLGFEASVASLPRGDMLTAEPAPSARPPQRIGNYDILETLGKGGMGVVYKAFDRRLERVVALKVLPSGAIGWAQRLFGTGPTPDEQLTRFRLEALAVAKLQDPRIVQIYDIGEHEGQPYIALEYVGGGSLAEKLRKERLKPRVAAEIVAKLARAVHHAHEHGVLHRDLKPSNVLLTPSGEPKIADFGLAKLQELPKHEAAMTHAGVILGTPSYMAPEQAAGKVKDIGPAVDIYSLGAILYESLAGRPPFKGASVYETLSQLATEPVVPLHELNPAVSEHLSTICLKCLEKDPRKRYSSADALAGDLERLLAGPASARDLAWRAPHRATSWKPFVLVAVIIGAVLAAILVAIMGQR